MRQKSAAAAMVLALVVTPASAQDAVTGRVANSSVGQAGQRQTQAVAGVAPLARVNTRVQNRIDARLRTRIDRDQTSIGATDGYDVAVRAISQTDDPK